MYKTIILVLIFYEREIYTLSQREGHKSRLFKKRVLRRMFQIKRRVEEEL
jgi:hypothetical protein